jgi:transcriptional regulator with XRE-family HTH domain
VTIARDLADFLTSRRARISPQDAGFSAPTRRRRVPGLRREEVALLAGISVEYYVQIERGNVRGVSEDVLESIARALHLDEVEHAHLLDLTRAIKQDPRRHASPAAIVTPTIQRVLDTITDAVAFVHNARSDFLAGNRLAYSLYSEAGVASGRAVSLPTFVFLDPKARAFYRKWEGIADATVGSLRTAAARDPYDRDLTDLIGELSTRSEDFRTMWASQDVTQYWGGTQYFHHPLVGDLDLDYVNFTMTANASLRLIVYSAPADSPSQQALERLGAVPRTG